MKWCSATHTSSKPASSAATAAATVDSSTAVWSWPGNCAARRNAPNRMGLPFADASAVPQLRTLVEQLAARGDEGAVAGAVECPAPEGRHAVAILKSQLHSEVPFQTAADRVGGQRPQQLPALSLAGRGYFVIGELRSLAGEFKVGHHAADDLPGVRQRQPHTIDEVGVGDLAVRGALKQLGRYIKRHGFLRCRCGTTNTLRITVISVACDRFRCGESGPGPHGHSTEINFT